MLKIKWVFICALSFFNVAQADKSIIMQSYPGTFISVAAEGGWNFKQAGAFHVNTLDLGFIFGNKTYNELGYRVSAGLQKYLCPNFSLVADLGYGYYGRTKFYFDIPSEPLAVDPTFFVLDQANMLVNVEGFDLLGGLSYDILKGVDLFLKAGAMVEHSHTSLNIAPLRPLWVVGDLNRTQILPEIKFGGSIKFCKEIYLTAAYMHVFGHTPTELFNIDVAFPAGTVNVARESTALDTLFLGIKWNITELC
jgi:hypothetical protein